MTKQFYLLSDKSLAAVPYLIKLFHAQHFVFMCCSCSSEEEEEEEIEYEEMTDSFYMYQVK